MEANFEFTLWTLYKDADFFESSVHPENRQWKQHDIYLIVVYEFQQQNKKIRKYIEKFLFIRLQRLKLFHAFITVHSI